jgi:hypothetical protein
MKIDGTPFTYNDTAEKLTALSQNQLLIHGSLISHNTIGGAVVNPSQKAVCPFYVASCDRISALPYDLNYFRAFYGKDESRAWGNAEYDDYSLIIEYDPRILSDPPPGVKTEF